MQQPCSRDRPRPPPPKIQALHPEVQRLLQGPPTAISTRLWGSALSPPLCCNRGRKQRWGGGGGGSPQRPPNPKRRSLLEELLVEEEEEEVDVDFGFAEHLHDGDALILQLQQMI